MSHAAQQIRDAIITALDAVGGLPTPSVHVPPQVDADAVAVVMRGEAIEIETIHVPPLHRRELTISVLALATSLDDADDMSVLIEEAIAAMTDPTPVLQSRDYEADIETQGDYFAIDHRYVINYAVMANSVDTPAY